MEAVAMVKILAELMLGQDEERYASIGMTPEAAEEKKGKIEDCLRWIFAEKEKEAGIFSEELLDRLILALLAALRKIKVEVVLFSEFNLQAQVRVMTACIDMEALSDAGVNALEREFQRLAQKPPLEEIAKMYTERVAREIEDLALRSPSRHFIVDCVKEKRGGFWRVRDEEKFVKDLFLHVMRL